ncbi:right-handed parallel beta-helix repeat-containing protein [Myxococcota bacterium]|nr:right-handed parallel beta-helix repeat-containing protein [Myxococcota bacterium]
MNRSHRRPRPARAGAVGLAVAAATLTFPLLAPAATLYVPDQYDSVADALAASQVGDTVILRSGTYYESVTVPEEVTLQGEEPPRTVLHAPSDDAAVVRLSHRAVLAGLAVIGGKHGVLVEDEIGGDPVEPEVRGVLVAGASRAGVEVRGGVLLTVRASTLADNTLFGAYATEAGRLTVRNSLVIGNGVGVEAEGGTLDILYNTVVSRNRNGGVKVHGPGYWGRIVNNTIVANDTAGVDVDGASTAEFRNNVVVFNDSGFFNVSGTFDGVTEHDDVYGNGADWTGMAAGPTDISVDPLFVAFDAAGDGWDDDLRLSAGSPCIDAADDSLAYQDPDETVGDLGAWGGPESGVVGANFKLRDVVIEPIAEEGCAGCGGSAPDQGVVGAALLLVPWARRRAPGLTPTRWWRAASTRRRTRRG